MILLTLCCDMFEKFPKIALKDILMNFLEFTLEKLLYFILGTTFEREASFRYTTRFSVQDLFW